MPMDLKKRLARIRSMDRADKKENPGKTDAPGVRFSLPAAFGAEWSPVASGVLKRSVESGREFSLPPVLPYEMAVLIPDFAKAGMGMIKPEDLVFFDLETSGLSGGAGTNAFLAAFGFFERKGEDAFRLRVDQYLLLDYPGENDFIESLLPVLGGKNKIIVTYNGKSFDSKLIRTRCLMNGIRPPEYAEADLLHPARRLWKRVLPSCSQAEIEVSVLGLDRSGDIPGAFAPQIWFDFLRSGDPRDLLEICGHNKKDIEGLASILSLMHDISVKPLDVLRRSPFDIEALALRWRDHAKWFPRSCTLPDQTGMLMAFALEHKYPRAMYAQGYDLVKKGSYDEGTALLIELAEMEVAGPARISALNCLAVDAEWRLRDTVKALAYVEAMLKAGSLSGSWVSRARERRERLLKKLSF